MSERQPIGLDFGTTKTFASRWDERSQRPVPIRLGRGSDAIPTSVHVDRDGNFTFGEDADDHRVSQPAGYFRRIKGDLGCPVTRKLPTGESATSTELIARFLQAVRERIEGEALHGPVGHTVITIPALYGPAARADLEAAAHRAGFNDFVLLEEPIAGGSAFLRDSLEVQGQNFAVFDWGGGTLDLAIIERKGEVLQAYPDLIGGDRELGGEDIDDLIEDAISRELSQAGKIPLNRQPNEYQIGALHALTIGKELLSRKMSHVIRLNLQDGLVELNCTRQQFEGFIIEVVRSAVTQLTRLLARSEAAGVKVDGVLLIGGSSEIPLVAQLIEEATGLKSHRYDYGQSAVGLGAMLHAHKATSGPQGPVNGADVEQSIMLQASHLGQRVDFQLEINGRPTTVRVEIPDPVSPAQRLRCQGFGMPGQNGGLDGDLILIVAEVEPPTPPAPMPGSDLRREYEVTPHIGLQGELWIGTRRVTFTVPLEFADGHMLRVVGQGEEGQHGGVNGDLLVVLKKPKTPPLPPQSSVSVMPPSPVQQPESIPSLPTKPPAPGIFQQVLSGIWFFVLLVVAISFILFVLGMFL